MTSQPYRRTRRVVPTIWVVSILLAANANSQAQIPIEGCGGAKTGTCATYQCVCKEWIIHLYRPDGREWGAITGSSLASVQEQLANSQKFDEEWARFAHQSVSDDPLNSQHPGPPTCRQECRTGATAEFGFGLANSDLAAGISSEVAEEFERVSKVLIKADQQPGPFRYGLVLKDYANALGKVQKQIQRVRTLMTATGRAGTSSMELLSAQQDLQTANAQARAIHNNLPPAVYLVLMTGNPAAGSFGPGPSVPSAPTSKTWNPGAASHPWSPVTAGAASGMNSTSPASSPSKTRFIRSACATRWGVWVSGCCTMYPSQAECEKVTRSTCTSIDPEQAAKRVPKGGASPACPGE